ncbi:Aste57867_11710 [Aphanomyces stellatus]|uniref:Aste57867_11710 protein n=1 Tax=Aphanomyces stellatus TaxID=120398 RepID=A0A485KTR8_9STRA|nr:hypothetical protein As57867_011667 [Aphanomyces stellatus]VFT88567.1 Aste57867_11710 [Aphanomyces stellatus]
MDLVPTPSVACATLASANSSSLVDYNYIARCVLSRWPPAAAIVFLVIVLLFLLHLLSSTATDFFSPSLQDIVHTYNIPPDLAGVTLLSFGNSSPDVFSNIAAVASASPKIGIALLLGGGLFVTTVVVAAVGLVAPRHTPLDPLSFVRDIGFYCLGLLYLYAVVTHEVVNVIHAVCFLAIYLLYIGVVVAVQTYRKSTPHETLDGDVINGPPSTIHLAQPASPTRAGSLSRKRSMDSSFILQVMPDDMQSTSSVAKGAFAARRLSHRCSTEITPLLLTRSAPALGALRPSFIQAILSSPAGAQMWTRSYVPPAKEADVVLAAPRHPLLAFCRLAWSPFHLALTLARRATIPLLDPDSWHKDLASVNPLCSVLFVVSTRFGWSSAVDMSCWLALVAVVGGGGGVFVLTSSSPVAPPTGWHRVPYLLLAFAMSLVWIMTIAQELVAVLDVLGDMLSISQPVLGVTVLAWGNSIGDLVANVSIARDGFPSMALAGCFASPMFALLVGVGLAWMIGTLRMDVVALGHPTPVVAITFWFLVASLLINFGSVAANGFRYNTLVCVGLLALYALYALVVCYVLVMVDDSKN